MSQKTSFKKLVTFLIKLYAFLSEFINNIISPTLTGYIEVIVVQNLLFNKIAFYLRVH